MANLVTVKQQKKEARLERKWEHLLDHYNKSQGFKTTFITKIASNWNQVKSSEVIEKVGFTDLETLLTKLIGQCQKQKWYKNLTIFEIEDFKNDCRIFLAGEIWDLKRQEAYFINPNLAQKAYLRSVLRGIRTFGNEAVQHGNKPISSAAKSLLECCESIKERLKDGVSDALLPDFQALIEQAEALVKSIQDKHEKCLEGYSNKLDEKLLILNPPNGLQSLQKGELYQFPEAK